MSFDIVIITNGPGELSTWVKPLAAKINNTLPEARIIVGIVPCPYASGEEDKIASNLVGVSYVLDSTETSKYLLSKKLPSGFQFQENGLVIHLGGDQFFSVMMGWRTKFPITVYTENHIFWPNIISKYFVADQNIYANARLRGIDASKLSIVGNLMTDAIEYKISPHEIRERLGLRADQPVVSLLPGSKPFKVKYSTPFMLKIADYIANKNPNIQFVISQSPYTPLYQLVGAVTDEKYVNALDGTYARFGRSKNGNVLVTEQGTVVNIIPPEFQYEAYQVSDVALTLPGTNTAELGILGVPMVTILPLNKPEYIPLEGFWGRLSSFPILGKYLKRFIVKQGAKKLKFISIPNEKSGREITPQLIGDIHPVKAANKVIELLNSPIDRREMSLNMKTSMGKTGATNKIIDELTNVLLKKYPDMEIFRITNNFTDWSKRESDSEY